MLYSPSNNDDHWSKKLKNLLEMAEKIWKLLEFLNFLLFLRGGQYRTLLERILRMKMVSQFLLNK